MNKASGGDGVPVELFQILKDDAVKVLHSICQQIWKTQDFQPGFRKGSGTRDQIANIRWIIEKARVPEKNLFLLY